VRRLRFPDWPPISWGTVFLAVMVGVLGLVYWQDHNRWGDYLGCARDQASAAVVRSGPAAELNNAQSHSTQANQRVLHVLGVIADFSRSHQGEQNPSDQVVQRSKRLVTRLGNASHRADTLADAVDSAQRKYNAVVRDHPIPECGTPPQ